MSDEIEEDDESDDAGDAILLTDGYCIILDKYVFMDALEMPQMVQMRGNQIWVYYYDAESKEWTYSEIKATERKKGRAKIAAVKPAA